MEESRGAFLDIATSSPVCEEDHLTRGDMDLVLDQLPATEVVRDLEAGIDMQREEEDEGPMGEEEMLQDEEGLSAREQTFLEEFPRWKQDQKRVIRKLLRLADEIDANHQRATKTKVISNSTAIISGVMSILGLALAPATAGGSLMLTAAGQGLGTIAGITNIVSDVLKNSRNKKAQAQANSLMASEDKEFQQAGGGKTSYVTALGKIVYACGNAVDNIKRNAQAYRLARTRPHLATAAKQLLKTGQVSAKSSRQVQKAFEGTVLAMKKGALMSGGVMAVIFLYQDSVALADDLKQLKEGTRAELAKEFWDKAQELEELVAEWTYYYERLQKKKLKKESF
ncbi:apolipoprotein L6-like isoform X1 [Dipodomys spectabilis]|uniref:apolipoprotein L6-like isoform X1 n=3 Tax=Dipodomys spectabilis TaxID=105255 RepID=UPI001C543CCA|nr:apolipoprotein L6-like isoform X1 [Dipodomys spectabilis]XP_042549283.1 apolipoprotein L6-like isoform X1 [Dipodomys spectabilis]